MNAHTKNKMILILSAAFVVFTTSSLIGATEEFSPVEVFETECADCHELDFDFKGMTKEESVAVLIDSVQGKVKSMKGLTLTPEEIDAMSAYIVTQ